ncbi:MAG TPA: PEGA domain-containing protein [Patescibacteria group bacterium]|nr:PEGA domain-containing protein [Patescibacteria group bacterium]
MEDEIKTNQTGLSGDTPPNIPVSPEINTPVRNLSTDPKPAENIDDLLNGTASSPKPASESSSFYYNPAQTSAPTSTPIPPKEASSIDAFNKRMASSRSSGEGSGNKKMIIGIIIAVVVVALAIAGYLLYLNTKKYSVTINVNPPEANISIPGSANAAAKNGKLVLNLKKGTYSVSISKDGYSTLKQTLNVKGSSSVNYNLSQFLTFSPVLEQNIMSPIINTELGTIIYLEKGEQWTSIKEYNYNSDDKKTVILADSLPDIKKITWSKTYRQAAVRIKNSEQNNGSLLPFQEQYGEGTEMNWVIDLDRKDVVNVNVKPLSPDIKNITFKPDGTKIAYYYNNGTKKTLAIANIDGTNYQNIVDIKTIQFDPDVIWSSDGVRIAIFADNPGGETNVFAYNFETKTEIDPNTNIETPSGSTSGSNAKLSTDNISYGALFSPSASKIIFNSGAKLSIYDFEKEAGSALLDTGAEAKITNCTWLSDDTVIAVTDNKELVKIKTTGEKITIQINQEGLPETITGIINDVSNVYLIGDTGIFSTPIANLNN